MNNDRPEQSKSNFLRFLAVCLAGTTASQMTILPVFAEGTTAGTTIINEATGTYEDGAGNPLDTT